MAQRRIILWIRPGDPLSSRAVEALGNIQATIDRSIAVRVKAVNESRPEVIRVPTLLFKLGPDVVLRLEDHITEDSIRDALRRLG